jgi:hypothetical protein
VKIGPGAPWVARSNAAQLLDMVLAAYGSKAILVDMDVDGPPSSSTGWTAPKTRPETGTNPQTGYSPAQLTRSTICERSNRHRPKTHPT